jgi:hypothetical protein
MLVSGLQSVLFAINIDNPSLNIPNKLQSINTSSTSKTSINYNAEEADNQFTPPITIDSSSVIRKESQISDCSSTSYTNKNDNSTRTKKSSTASGTGTSNNRKVKKNNIVLDGGEEDGSGKTDKKLLSKSPTVTPTSSLTQIKKSGTISGIEFEFDQEETTTQTFDRINPSADTNNLKSVTSSPLLRKKEFSILENPINYTKQQSQQEVTTPTKKAELNNSNILMNDDLHNGSPIEATTSPSTPDNKQETDIYSDKFNPMTITNLIPISAQSPYAKNFNSDNLSGK